MAVGGWALCEGKPGQEVYEPPRSANRKLRAWRFAGLGSREPLGREEMPTQGQILPFVPAVAQEAIRQLVYGFRTSQLPHFLQQPPVIARIAAVSQYLKTARQIKTSSQC